MKIALPITIAKSYAFKTGTRVDIFYLTVYCAKHPQNTAKSKNLRQTFLDK
ncbi:MAG: hypothetical protein WBK20_11965 [Spirochaetota bacterium]